MTTNRLAKSEAAPKKSPQELCDEGNARIAAIGRAHEIEWRMVNGRPELGWIRGSIRA